MNNEWIDFLEAHPVDNTGDTPNTLTAITDLAILKVSGKDASQFLQGQLTCNIHELTDANSFFTAFCNAKGRTISTLLILKNDGSFLLILPVELMEKVINKLKMYILRANVKLDYALDSYCLIGLNSTDTNTIENFPATNFEVSNGSEITIKLPANQDRYLIISKIDRGKQLWTQLTQTHHQSEQWSYQDISAGLAWLNTDSSEQYIPQMLNIDKLGGISFNKGCYTGQEIVARTHYLGKAKRALFLAECDKTTMVDRKTQIISHDNKQNIGKFISFQHTEQSCRMLIVIAISSELNNLILDNSKQDKISIIDFQ